MTQQYDNYGRDMIIIDKLNGNVHVAPSVTGQELLNKAIELLNKRSYQQAIDVLNDATKTDPSLSDAYYYLAIALLSGIKPRKIDGWTIQSIEEKLNSAVNGVDNPAKVYVLWAIVKHGYYIMNGFLEKPPTSAQLFNQGESSIQAEHAKEILYHLDDPKNTYWIQLHNRFGIS